MLSVELHDPNDCKAFGQYKMRDLWQGLRYSLLRVGRLGSWASLVRDPRSRHVGMNPVIRQLIPAIVSYVTDHGGYLTKTKLLKLLYLFDVEYFRVHRRTFSGFNWKFFHLGPWTPEFDPIVQDLVEGGYLTEASSTRTDYETRFYRTPEHLELEDILKSYKEEAILREILDVWGDRTTGEILDHVYFRTEPMELGSRNEPLDFNKIAEQAPPKYVRSASGIKSEDLKAQRERFAKDRASRLEGRQSGSFFTPPNYDEEFLEALAKLDQMQS
jgi:hypothetical protein